MKTEQVTIELLQFGLAQRMSPGLLKLMKVTEEPDVSRDLLLRQVQFYLLGNKVHQEEYDDEVATYPATMWEELKEDFAPKWFLKRFPVRYSTNIRHRTVKYYRVCPHLDVPDRNPHVRFLIGDDNV